MKKDKTNFYLALTGLGVSIVIGLGVLIYIAIKLQ